MTSQHIVFAVTCPQELNKMLSNFMRLFFLGLYVVFDLVQLLPAQGVQPYPNAITNRLIYQETPMAVPPRNVVFTDPDFSSKMVRATDPTTNFKLPGTYLRTEASGEANEWAMDTSKFYVVGAGGQALAYAFNPNTMVVSSLPNATPGQALLLPLRTGATFSFADPDLLFGTSEPDTLIIQSYRFSTGITTPVIDTHNCGLQPPLESSAVSDDDVRSSANDMLFSISEGGTESGDHMFVVVYDTKHGCRWYNTQTGQIGGQWGMIGTATVTSPYLIRHAYLSRSGKYVVILVDNFGWYVWDLASLTVTSCAIGSGNQCNGYKTVGYNTMVNGPAVTGDMQTAIRPLSDIDDIAQLVIPVPFVWDQEQLFTWNDVNTHDNTPVCGSTHNYEGDSTIDQPWSAEIFCIETDGLASTVWRFAHNRALYIEPYFQTQPLGNVSRNGRFFLFTSTWDGQLGNAEDGTPLSDVFIVRLD
jgi:hypothetical protein